MWIAGVTIGMRIRGRRALTFSSDVSLKEGTCGYCSRASKRTMGRGKGHANPYHFNQELTTEHIRRGTMVRNPSHQLQLFDSIPGFEALDIV